MDKIHKNILYNLPRLNHEEIKNLNKLQGHWINNKKTSQQRKAQDKVASAFNSTKHLKKN